MNFLSMFVLLVLFPPQPDAARTHFVEGVLRGAFGEGAFDAIHSVVWVAIAAVFYAFERAGRRA